MRQYIKTAVVASAGIAVFSSSALAAYNDQDVLLSFRAAGAASDFTVDLGQASQFTASSSFNLSTVGYNAADLVSVFGSLNNVIWSAWAGNSASGGNQGWISGATSTPWLDMTATAMRNVDSAINNFAGGNIVAANLFGTSTTEYKYSSAGTVSFTKYQSSGGTINGTFASQGSTDVGDGVNFGTTGYLTAITASPITPKPPGTLLGTFTFDATTGQGMWNGSSVAAPEPATYGAISGLGLLALALRRQLMSKSV
jgi:hypothetical protein